MQNWASREVVDLTTGSPEDDVVVTPASKRARVVPLPFSAAQPPPGPAKPDAKCAICLEPMAEMACGPCGCAPLAQPSTKFSCVRARAQAERVPASAGTYSATPACERRSR